MSCWLQIFLERFYAVLKLSWVIRKVCLKLLCHLCFYKTWNTHHQLRGVLCDLNCSRFIILLKKVLFLCFMENFIHVEYSHILFNCLQYRLLCLHHVKLLLRNQSPITVLTLAVCQLEVSVIFNLQLFLNNFYFCDLLKLKWNQIVNFPDKLKTGWSYLWLNFFLFWNPHLLFSLCSFLMAVTNKFINTNQSLFVEVLIKLLS